MKVSWICSICREGLATDDKTLVCRNGHRFDVAREGYVNLLGGKARKGLVGDTAEMLAARRRFLEAGHYEPLRRRLAEIVRESNAEMAAEVGCGEGYYIGGVSEAVPGAVAFGTDIAKDGVRMAAKRYSGAKFAVADTYELVPLPDGGVDVLLDVFAPRNASEFARVLRPGGRLVVVIPAEGHLAELRAVYPLLQIQPDKRRAVEAALSSAFELERAERLTLPMNLTGSEVTDLIGMTPNAWFSERSKRILGDEEQVLVTAEFEILVFTGRI